MDLEQTGFVLTEYRSTHRPALTGGAKLLTNSQDLGIHAKPESHRLHSDLWRYRMEMPPRDPYPAVYLLRAAVSREHQRAHYITFLAAYHDAMNQRLTVHRTDRGTRPLFPTAISSKSPY